MTNYKLYFFLAVLALFIIVPMWKSQIQEGSLGKDLFFIRMEYSLRGREWFREKLNEIILRAPLDPKDVEIRMQENRSESNVLIEIRYVSRMKILFYPIERQVVVRREIPLVPIE